MSQEGFKRKLTAILSADVVGYSRLMDDNEREKKAMQSDNTFFLYSFIVGIIPVNFGLILMHLS